MKTRVKKDTCIGCGACTVIANNIFQIGDDGLAEAINGVDEAINGVNKEKVANVEDSECDNVVDASESCPVGAIEVINE